MGYRHEQEGSIFLHASRHWLLPKMWLSCFLFCFYQQLFISSSSSFCCDSFFVLGVDSRRDICFNKNNKKIQRGNNSEDIRDDNSPRNGISSAVEITDTAHTHDMVRVDSFLFCSNMKNLRLSFQFFIIIIYLFFFIS